MALKTKQNPGNKSQGSASAFTTEWQNFQIDLSESPTIENQKSEYGSFKIRKYSSGISLTDWQYNALDCFSECYPESVRDDVIYFQAKKYRPEGGKEVVIFRTQK